MEVVGHRGARLLAPENTLPGFLKAIELGCEMTECDVRLTRDGVPVVIHDETVDRTTNGKGALAALDLATVRGLDAGGGAQVPTLDEVLDAVAGKIGLMLELKGEGTVPSAAAAVRQRKMVDQVIFTCFDFGRLDEARAMGDELRLGGILSMPDVAALDRLVAMHAVSLGVHHQFLTPSYVRLAQERGLSIRTWTPNTEDELRRAISMRPDGITTDRPDLAIEIVRGG